MRVFLKAAASAALLLCVGCAPEQKQPAASVPHQATAPTVTAAAQSATAEQASAAAAQAKAKAAESYKVQQLINNVEQAYRTGVENYRAGRMDAAHQDFDYAVDQMLTSGLDIKGDPQLSDEFEHVVDSINSLEMDALKQNNGFIAHLEPAPADTNEVTFPPNPALTAKLNAELKTTQSDFPLVINDYVAGFINYFSNSQTGHAHLVHSLERAGKYDAMISKVLKAQGVPQDLIYLAVAESGFQPQALNPSSGAGGMWQFMPFASSYGLIRNGWVDERFDPVKSTVAYANYLKELYNQFGDWYLALAAYNWGPGNVQRAVQRTGYADFWELYRRNVLPAETKNYVPAIIAAIIMAKNPKQYGLESVVPDAPVLSDTVTINYSINLRLVSDLVDAPLQETVSLNPSLLRMDTPRDLDYDLHLPPGTMDLFQKRVSEIPEEKRAYWRFHVVKEGESLDEIAESFHVRAKEIASENDLSANDEIAEGDELVIPVAPAAASDRVRTRHYRIRRGDTLISIADRFNVSVEQLRAWNHMRSNRIVPGHTITVAEPVHLAPATRVRHRSTHRRSTRRRSTKSSSHSSPKKSSRHTQKKKH
ncbi:MAG: lytic transglycosylase domain-containing protein [Acidobacteriaceae bacterium]